MHIVTANLYSESHARFTMEDDVNAAEHEIVNRMTNYITELHRRINIPR